MKNHQLTPKGYPGHQQETHLLREPRPQFLISVVIFVRCPGIYHFISFSGLSAIEIQRMLISYAFPKHAFGMYIYQFYFNHQKASGKILHSYLIDGHRKHIWIVSVLFYSPLPLNCTKAIRFTKMKSESFLSFCFLLRLLPMGLHYW